MRDRHPAGRQFMDVRRSPTMEMRGTAIEAAERPGTCRGTFELVIRDVMKPDRVSESRFSLTP